MKKKTFSLLIPTTLKLKGYSTLILKFSHGILISSVKHNTMQKYLFKSTRVHLSPVSLSVDFVRPLHLGLTEPDLKRLTLYGLTLNFELLEFLRRKAYAVFHTAYLKCNVTLHLLSCQTLGVSALCKTQWKITLSVIYFTHYWRGDLYVYGHFRQHKWYIAFVSLCTALPSVNDQLKMYFYM